MSTTTVPMPDEDLAFLKAWSEKQGISPETLLARQAHNLREHLQGPLHPDLAAAIGVITSGTDEETCREYLERKHE